MDLTWQKQALCNNTDPNLYDLDWISNKWGMSDWRAQDEYAKTMCAGCPVVRECAASALETVDVSDYALTPDGSSGVCQTEGVIRAGVALRGGRGCKHRGRKRLAVLAGVEWRGLVPSVRWARACVGCGLGFADGGGWGVGRASARLCVFCSGRRQAAA